MALKTGERLLCLLSCFLQAFAQIRIVAPAPVVREFTTTRGQIEGSTATFGAPFYGDRVLGRLIWAGESKHGHVHCTEEDYDVVVPQQEDSGTESASGNLINIIMVRRGQCPFTKKVEIAYRKGAHAVIIVDRDDSPMTKDDVRRIIVADDGYGDKIHIPSILISKEEGGRLISASKALEVIVELNWNIPTNHVVEMDLWMSSGSKESMTFLKDFAERRKTLNEVVQFRPHYAVFKLKSTDPGIYNDICSDSSGEYCTEDPDGSGVVTGKDVLEEDVRQLCIHELTKVPRTSLDDLRAGKAMVEYAQKYWDYVKLFADNCPVNGATPETRFGTPCAELMMPRAGLSVPEVQKCIASSKDAKLKEQRENSAWSPRALRINGWRYSGMMEADLVTRAICSGFVSQPDECKTLLAPRNPFEKYMRGMQVPGGVSLVTVLISFLVFSVLCLGALILYKRSLQLRLTKQVREEVMIEVQTQMAEYSRLQA
jgi:hypothetical protein